jgi:hypothetical protein
MFIPEFHLSQAVNSDFCFVLLKCASVHSPPAMPPLSTSRDKLVPAVHTILLSLTSLGSMFRFTTIPDRDILVYHLTTVWAEADRNVQAPVIKI